MNNEPSPILLLGDPRLREQSREIVDFDEPDVVRSREALATTLGEFRRRHGFGRAISAPQIGASVRLIAIDFGDGPFFVANPVVTWESSETFTMWDDCMSFPGLLVRLARHRSISLRYRNERGDERSWELLDTASAEILQHEIDHLDGILAVDRAIDRDSLVLREVFESRRTELRTTVDYAIGEPMAR
jgi:peptide deformylase